MTTSTTKSKLLPRDSLIVYIPLSVTADLGVAMKRVRAKRLSQIKQLCPSLFHDNDNNNNNNADNKLQKKDNSSNNQPSNTKKQKTQEYNDNNNNDDDDTNGEENDDDHPSMITKNNKNSNTGIIRREQFGSIVEYLEAKYARGVMIDDLDERIRKKKKEKRKKIHGKKNYDNNTNDNNYPNDKKGNKTTSGKEEEEDDDDMSILSESAAGSCYSNESGNFIDDSELRNEVAHQILGSSTYGKTKIEAKGAAAANANDDDSDHGFFVNIGDLEMEEEGWRSDLDDEEDWIEMMAKSKGKKRKRSTTKDGAGKDGDNKDKKKIKKSTNFNDGKKSKLSNSDANKSKSASSSGGDQDKKKSTKSNTNSTKDTPTSSKSQDKKEKISSQTPKSRSGGADDNSSDEKKDNDKEPSIKKEMVVDESKAALDAARKECTNLKRRVTRLFKKCVDEIKKLTNEHLPRKAKKGGKSKVSIIVPEGKRSGDKISFNNPHDPSQKLQVLIPENCAAGETFKVSVPMPTVTESSSNTENRFSKECINALDEYSQVYDDWCQAEAKYRELLPTKKKGPEFKVGTERLKKYDQMIEEFPKNLQTPIDAPFLRKVVRRKRQNENKKMRLMEESSKKDESPMKKVEKKKKCEPVMLNLNLPCISQDFPTILFKVSDFGKTN